MVYTDLFEMYVILSTLLAYLKKLLSGWMSLMIGSGLYVNCKLSSSNRKPVENCTVIGREVSTNPLVLLTALVKHSMIV